MLVVVAGHICLDIIPHLETVLPDQFAAWLQPGHLIEIGPAAFATGGCVSNTGLALHTLGVPVRLIGKVGGDRFGQLVRDIIAGYAPALADGLIVDAASSTSYTLVLNPPHTDRTFLHNPGANHTVGAADIDYD